MRHKIRVYEIKLSVSYLYFYVTVCFLLFMILCNCQIIKKSHLKSLSELEDLIQPWNHHIHFQVVFSVLFFVGNRVHNRLHNPVHNRVHKTLYFQVSLQLFKPRNLSMFKNHEEISRFQTKDNFFLFK